MALKRWTFVLTDGTKLVVTAPNSETVTLFAMGTEVRFKTDGTFQMKDRTDSLWYDVYLDGGQFVVGATGEA